MPFCSLRELAALTRKNVDTIVTRLEGLEPKIGPRKAKMYKSEVALERIYLGDGSGSHPQSEAESRRSLNAERQKEISLNMEIKRRTRIPLKDAEELVEFAVRNAAGVLKAAEARGIPADVIADTMAQLREIGPGIRKYALGAEECTTD